MNNLRKFTTEAEYTAATLNYPSVSWVTSTDVVHFDKESPTPTTFSGLTVYYNISDISSPTDLFYAASGSGSGSGGVLPSSMIIDGTEVEVTNAYQFSTTGEHIVQYSFNANEIPSSFIESYGNVTKFEIGDAITSIGEYSLDNNSNLTSVTIGSAVTSISDGAFIGCTSLTGITCLATTPPTLGGNDVFAVTNDCPIYVPAASVSAYINASSWDAYTHRIQAIP